MISTHNRLLKILLYLAVALVIALLLAIPGPGAAVSRVPIAWAFTPTLDIYLSLVMHRPAIGDVDHLLVTEVLYDPDAAQGGVEWIEIFNPTGEIIDLSGYKLGDEESLGGGEGMLQFPPGAQIGVGQVAVIAADATLFAAAFGFNPEFEFQDSGSPVPEMVKYTAWAGGSVVLTNAGDEVLLLDVFDDLVDAVSWGSSNWAFDPDVPGVAKGHSIERLPGYVDTDSAFDWEDQPAPTPGLVDLTMPTPTPTATNGPSPTPPAGGLLLSEVLYDPLGAEPAAEWIELHNATGAVINLSGYKIGDEETSGGSEGMYSFPVGSQIPAGGVIVIANSASVFSTTYGFLPDYELTGTDPSVPDLEKYLAWSGGSISLSNVGDELLLLDPADLPVDTVSWGTSTWAFDPPVPDALPGQSIERFPAGLDTDSAADWRAQPAPGPGALPPP